MEIGSFVCRRFAGKCSWIHTWGVRREDQLRRRLIGLGLRRSSRAALLWGKGASPQHLLHWPSVDTGSRGRPHEQVKEALKLKVISGDNLTWELSTPTLPGTWNRVPRLRPRQHNAEPRGQISHDSSVPVSLSFLSANTLSVSELLLESHTDPERPQWVISPLLLPGSYRFLHFWTNFYISSQAQGFHTW